MAVWSRIPLSGSTDGRPVAISSTGSPGSTVHTAATATQVTDHVYAYAANTATRALLLTMEFGGTASADQIIVSIPSQDGHYKVLDGIPLKNSLIFRGFATQAAGLAIAGYVNRASAT